MKNRSHRLLIFLVFIISGCFLFPDSMQAGGVVYTLNTNDTVPVFSPYSVVDCHLYPESVDDDGDIEKDLDNDGNFSKDLEGPSNLKPEIVPIIEDYKNDINSPLNLRFRNAFHHLNHFYETPYLCYFQPPKIAFI